MEKSTFLRILGFLASMLIPNISSSAPGLLGLQFGFQRPVVAFFQRPTPAINFPQSTVYQQANPFGFFQGIGSAAIGLATPSQPGIAQPSTPPLLYNPFQPQFPTGGNFFPPQIGGYYPGGGGVLPYPLPVTFVNGTSRNATTVIG